MYPSRRATVSPLTVFAATALLALACASSVAQAAPATADSVRVSVTSPYRLTIQEALDIEQQYLLSNQQIFIVREQDSHFFGRLANKHDLHARREVEIFPQAPNLFITQSGTSIAFSNAGEHVVIDDAQYLPGLRMPADSRSANTAGTANGSTSVRLVSR